jgi:hypothetical protein
LKELATKEVTIYLDARDRHGEWKLRIRKSNRQTGTSSQVYASQLNVHLDLREGDVVMFGSADWLAVARAANGHFAAADQRACLGPTD